MILIYRFTWIRIHNLYLFSQKGQWMIVLCDFFPSKWYYWNKNQHFIFRLFFFILPDLGQWNVGRFMKKRSRILKRKKSVATLSQSEWKCILSNKAEEVVLVLLFKSKPRPVSDFPMKACLSPISQSVICRLQHQNHLGSWVDSVDA